MKVLCIGGPLAGEVVENRGLYLEAVENRGRSVYASDDNLRTGIYRREGYVNKIGSRKYFYACYIWDGLSNSDAQKLVDSVLNWSQGMLDNSFASCAR